MNKEDKLIKIIDGLQDTIRKLENDNTRLTLNQKETLPYPWTYPHTQCMHPLGCTCSQCSITYPSWSTGTITDTFKFTIGDVA